MGITVGVLIFTVLGWLLWRRWKRQTGYQKEGPNGEVNKPTAIEQRSTEQPRIEQVARELGGRAMPPLLDSHELHQLDTVGAKAELPTYPVAELSATPHANEGGWRIGRNKRR